ncbi:MAG: M24 family metallopeptidase [Nitrososphaerales archaeon]
MADSSSRVKRIFRHIVEDKKIKEKPTVFVLANGVEPHLDSSFFYVTGFPYGLFEGSFLVAEQSGAISLITSPLEESIARAFAPKNLQIYVETEIKAIQSRLRKLVGSTTKNIGVNSPELSYSSFLQMKLVLSGSKFQDISESFESARMIKDASEIAAIQEACDIASKTFRKIPSALKEGVSESAVAAKMAYEMQSLGGSGVSFETIVGFGKNSSQPHYSAGSAKLKNGQFVLCDYGTRYHRYCSDITRTLVYGKASKKQRRMYEVVRSALELGEELCTLENTTDLVHKRVAQLIDATEFKGRFIHSTGHSLGLNVHDGPGLSFRNKRKLEPGMVMTVEPGIYVPGFGGVRIEDDVLITKGKPRVLTSATRELIEV